MLNIVLFGASGGIGAHILNLALQRATASGPYTSIARATIGIAFDRRRSMTEIFLREPERSVMTGFFLKSRGVRSDRIYSTSPRQNGTGFTSTLVKSMALKLQCL